MNKLLQRLNNDPFTLMVSLPHNDPELARAAIRGGAQGLKIHINVHHHASGTHFGSWAEERNEIEAILEEAGDAPVGIVPGGTPFATPDEFTQMAAAGIDFFDAYPAEAPAWTLQQQYLDCMLAAYHGCTFDTILALQEIGMEMCEASIMHHDDYGKELTALDLARYHDLGESLDDEVPFIVPSQKLIHPNEVELLRRVGAAGLLIGAIVTGKEAEGIEAATRAFRTEIDQLS